MRRPHLGVHTSFPTRGLKCGREVWTPLSA